MAAVVGSIVGELIADASQFDRSLQQSEARTVRFQTELGRRFTAIERSHATMATRIAAIQNRAIASIGKGLQGIAASSATTFAGLAAGALSFSAAISKAREAIEDYGRIADQSAAAGLDAEFFQGLAYQVSLSGVEVDSLAASLATFAKNSGLAVEGKGKMVGALKALNAGLLEAITKATTMEERVRLAADAISKAGSSAEAAALATTLFGDAGARLVAAFQGGAAEVDAMLAKARDLDIVVGRDVVASVDEIGDQLDTASKILDMRLKRAFVDLAPVILTAANAAAEFARLIGITADGLRTIEERQYLRPLQNQLAALYNEMAPVKDRVAELEAALAGSGPNGMILKLDLQEAKARLAEMEGQANRLLSRIQELQGYKAPGTSPAPATSEPSPNTMGGADLQLLDLNVPGTARLDGVASGVSRIRTATTELTAATEAQNASLRAQQQAYAKLADDVRYAEGMAQQFAGNLLDDLLAGRSLTDSLSDAFGDLANQLLKMALNRAISSLFSNLLGAAFGLPTASSLGQTGMYGWEFLPSARGNVFSGPGISAYSNKIVNSPVLFPFAKGIGLMGEAGAEAIMPLKRARDGSLGISADMSKSFETAGAGRILIALDKGLRAEFMDEAARQTVRIVKDSVPPLIKRDAPAAVAVANRNRGI